VDRTQIPLLSDLRQQAQGGDVRALEAWLNQAIANPKVCLEASRRGQTLYVFVTVPPNEPLATYAEAVYEAIRDLHLLDLNQLTVLDGHDGSQLDRWRRSFFLPSLKSASLEVNPTLPSSADLGTHAVTSTVLAQASLTVGEDSNIATDVNESVAQPSQIPADINQAIAQLSDSSQTKVVYQPTKPLKQPRLWMVLVGLMTLGLGTVVVQWYSQRTVLNAVPASPPQPLAPAFSQTQIAALATVRLQPPATLTLNAVGDIIPGTDYQRYRLPQDWQYLFRSIQYQLADADLVFGNFESTLTEVPNSAKDTRRPMTFAFRTPPWYASVLKEAGFNVLSVANNHSFDFGEQGFAETISHIESAGMKAIGRQGDILYMEVENTTVAFIAFSHLSRHNTIHDLNIAATLVQTAKAQADIVVVSFHAGKEGTDAIYTRDQTEFFYSENRGNVVQFSRTVIDHGADLVLGHGPHVPRALELYQNKLIAYSLGNFLGYRTLSTVGPLGVSLILQTRLNADGDFVSGRIIPVALDPNGVPYLDDYFQSVVLLRNYTRRDFPQTPLEIDDMGYVWRTE
jgi:poly-gamma-glutamate capsule biosynthesis protein CapA/YwtB (metallophosphatase superfamily)/cytochrome c-type biogenesis protein CcmH/NrfF